MRDEINLDEAGRRVIPIRERPDRDRAPERRWRPVSAPTGTDTLALRTKSPVDRGRADRHQRGTDFGDEVRDGHVSPSPGSNVGIIAFSRLPQIWSDASQRTISASRTASL